MFCIGNFLLQIFALEGFVKGGPVGLTDSELYMVPVVVCSVSRAFKKRVGGEACFIL